MPRLAVRCARRGQACRTGMSGGQRTQTRSRVRESLSKPQIVTRGDLANGGVSCARFVSRISGLLWRGRRRPAGWLRSPGKGVCWKWRKNHQRDETQGGKMKTEIKEKRTAVTSELSASRVVSEAEWLVARKDLLTREKELTRLRDELSRHRRELPWVKIEKEYVFDGPAGKETLSDLFEGRSQLVIYHFML